MGPLAAEVRVGELNDSNEMAIHRLVSAYPPFNQFSYPLMIGKIREQLMLKSHVMLMVGDRLVGYAGWSPVDASDAEDWYQGRRDFPSSRLEPGTAAIVSITVVTSPEYLSLIIKAISHQCDGMKVYRLRSFQDGRNDMRRPPILGKNSISLPISAPMRNYPPWRTIFICARQGSKENCASPSPSPPHRQRLTLSYINQSVLAKTTNFLSSWRKGVLAAMVRRGKNAAE